MLPADDEVTLAGVVGVLAELAAAKFELEAHTLPAVAPLIDAAQGLAIGVKAVESFHEKP